MKGRLFIKFVNALIALFILFGGSFQHIYAQDSALQELLEQYPETSETELEIFTLASKIKVGKIDFSDGYTLIKQEGGWSLIRFNKPTVPLWVSADFVEQRNNIAIVSTARLNVRLAPDINACLLYTSPSPRDA